MRGVIFVNVERCLACKSCELECAVAHSKSKNLFEAIREVPLPQSRVKVEAVEDLSMPMQCRHCEDPPCVTVCPTKGITKLGIEEPVIVKDELCIGCKLCILICPFGVFNMNREGKIALKCDLCVEKLEKDEKPACVRACPTHALQYKTIEEITSEMRKRTVGDFLVAVRKGKVGKGE